MRDGLRVHARYYEGNPALTPVLCLPGLSRTARDFEALADHLAGDVYSKVHREGHNLDRARVQFRMVERMDRDDDGALSMQDRHSRHHWRHDERGPRGHDRDEKRGDGDN